MHDILVCMKTKNFVQRAAGAEWRMQIPIKDMTQAAGIKQRKTWGRHCVDELFKFMND